MKLKTARALRPGKRVACPADRGDPSFIGTVTHVGSIMSKCHTTNESYIWIEVQRPGHHKSVWPSNRLGAA